MEWQFESVNGIFRSTITKYWDRDALSNYNGNTITFADMATQIERLHILFEAAGLQKGDKVSICGRNQANWSVAFFASLFYGAVAVPILHEFKSGNVHHLVNHSETRILFVDEQVWENLNEAEMPDVKAIILIKDFSLLVSRNEALDKAARDLDALMTEKYPMGLRPEDLRYHDDLPEELAVINYTSGTSGFSKGVMLPYRSLWSNIFFGRSVHGEMSPEKNLVAILPTAHMYGLMFEVMFQLSQGVHIHFLTRVPSPKIILAAMGEIKPDLIIAVPLIIEKIYKNMLKPELEKAGISTMRRWLPGFEQLMMSIMRKKLVDAFGGRFSEIIIGGAAFNREVEAFFHKMKFPFTVGYGMTECGPIITYAHWYEARLGSSGRQVPNMEVRVDSDDPANISGEILCRGANVFTGYYKNEEATAQAFTADGWFRTGDVGVIDEDGFLFIRGRSKCMILGPNGQNIYPEELETVLNNMQYVVDSLVVEDAGALTAIIYPDFRQGEKDGMDAEKMKAFIEKSVAEVNREFPNYSKIKNVEILPEDFERTPKKSIKRYLYQR